LIRQELETIHDARGQGGLTVYTTINVDAQKKAYEVVCEGLRRYDRSHRVGARVNHDPTANNVRDSPRRLSWQITSIRIWYGNDDQNGRYLIAWLMKRSDRCNEATVSLWQLHHTVSGAEMGWFASAPKRMNSKSRVYLAEFY